MGELDASTGFAREMLRRNPDLRARWDEHGPKRRLALWLRAARQEAGLTQTALAERTGMSQPQISRIEDVSGPLPDLATIHDYLRGCGRTVVLSHTDADAPTELAEQPYAIAV